MSIRIRMAQVSDADTVANLVHALLSELTPAGKEPPDRDVVRLSTMAVLTHNGGVWAFVAEDDPREPVGVLTLNECASIYAGGRFGEISECTLFRNSARRGSGRNCLEKLSLLPANGIGED